MHERLRLVHGEFTVRSQASQGTTAIARVPTRRQVTVERGAGRGRTDAAHELGHRHLVDDRVGVPDAGGDLWAGVVQEPHRLAHLLFAATAASTAVFTFCELWLMRVETPGELLRGAEVGTSGLALLARVDHLVRAASIWGPGGSGSHGPSAFCARSTCCPGSCGTGCQLPRDHESAAGPVSGRVRHDLQRHPQSMDAARPRDDVADPHLRRGCQRHGLAPGRPPQGAHGRWECRVLLARRISRDRADLSGDTSPCPSSSARSTSAWSR